jgi:hypothetical protein
MLKLFKKDGIIMVFNDNQTMDECYFMINNYHKDKGEKGEKGKEGKGEKGEKGEKGKEEKGEKGEKGEKDKKEYYTTKGFTYPQLN